MVPLPAIGVKARHNGMSDTAGSPLTTGRSIQVPPWESPPSHISIDCVGYIEYRAEPMKPEAGLVGQIQLSTFYFELGVCEMDGLKLAVYQCMSI